MSRILLISVGNVNLGLNKGRIAVSLLRPIPCKPAVFCMLEKQSRVTAKIQLQVNWSYMELIQFKPAKNLPLFYLALWTSVFTDEKLSCFNQKLRLCVLSTVRYKSMVGSGNSERLLILSCSALQDYFEGFNVITVLREKMSHVSENFLRSLQIPRHGEGITNCIQQSQ